MQRHSRIRFHLIRLTIAMTAFCAAAACGDSGTNPFKDTIASADVDADTAPAATTSRFLGVVVTDSISPRGIAGATVTRLDDPDQMPLKTDASGFFEADVPNDKPHAWLVVADGNLATIAVMPTWYADSDHYFQITLRSQPELARVYANVAATGAPEPMTGRSHVEVRGIYSQFEAWATGMTVTADTPVVYAVWDEEPPEAPRTRADDRYPMAWMPNVDPATETVAFTMRDRFENVCVFDPMLAGENTFTVPVRADTITTVYGFCQFPVGQRPLAGRILALPLEIFESPTPAVGVEVCIDGDDVCTTANDDGVFHMSAPNDPVVVLRVEAAGQLAALWPIVRPHAGEFRADHLFIDPRRTSHTWSNNYPNDATAGAAFGKGVDVYVNLDIPVGDVVVQVDGGEMKPWYRQENFDTATRRRIPGGAWFFGVPESVIENGHVTLWLGEPVPERCRGQAWFSAFFAGPAMMKVPAVNGHLTFMPSMTCD